MERPDDALPELVRAVKRVEKELPLERVHRVVVARAVTVACSGLVVGKECSLHVRRRPGGKLLIEEGRRPDIANVGRKSGACPERRDTREGRGRGSRCPGNVLEVARHVDEEIRRPRRLLAGDDDVTRSSEARDEVVRLRSSSPVTDCRGGACGRSAGEDRERSSRLGRDDGDVHVHGPRGGGDAAGADERVRARRASGEGRRSESARRVAGISDAARGQREEQGLRKALCRKRRREQER